MTRRVDKTTPTYRWGYRVGVLLGALLALACILGLLWCVYSISHALIGA